MTGAQAIVEAISARKSEIDVSINSLQELHAVTTAAR
jgi:hypothetical protein